MDKSSSLVTSYFNSKFSQKTTIGERERDTHTRTDREKDGRTDRQTDKMRKKERKLLQFYVHVNHVNKQKSGIHLDCIYFSVN